jgi:hypothetical protein
LVGRVHQDRPAKLRERRSTVAALILGFVISLTVFALFTRWLIREA